MLSQDPRRRFNRNRPGHVWRSHERKRHFGIVTAPLIAGLVDAGLSAGVADVAGTALVGAGLGAGTSALTGGNIGIGALTGGITGGALGGLGGAGGVVDSATGLGAVGSDVLIGGGAGALGSALTGGNVATGALGGAAAGGIAGLSTPSGAAAGSPTSGGASAIGSAAPAGAGAVDLTGGGDLANIPSASSIGQNLGLNAPAGTSFGADLGGAGGITPASSVGSGLGLQTPGGPGGALSTGGPGSAGSGLTPTAGGAAGAGSGGANGFNYDTSTTGKILNSLGVTTAGQDPGILAGGIAKNPGALVGAAGLGFNLLQGNSVPDQSKLEGQAQQLSTQGKELASYLQSGQLPAGAQAALSQATNAAKASVRSNFASQGLSGSQQEAQALQQIDLNAASQQFSIADKLLTQGLDETKLSSNIYSDLLKVNEQQTKDTGSAIANFAASLGGFQTPKVAGG